MNDNLDMTDIGVLIEQVSQKMQELSLRPQEQYILMTPAVHACLLGMMGIPNDGMWFKAWKKHMRRRRKKHKEAVMTIKSGV